MTIWFSIADWSAVPESDATNGASCECHTSVWQRIVKSFAAANEAICSAAVKLNTFWNGSMLSLS
jgi:hypothetical protein